MQTNKHPPQPSGVRPPGVPSRRVVGTLMAGALTIGVLAGVSLAPAPPSSLASGSTVITRLLALLVTQAQGSPHPSAAVAPAASTAPTLAASAHSAGHASHEGSEVTTASSQPGETGENTSSERSAPASGKGEGKGGKKPAKLPPISHVWLIVLSGPSFAEASAQPDGYPYLTGQLLGQGTLLERYSAIEGYELAGDAALLTGGVGESVSTISEPGCQQPASSDSIGTATAGATSCAASSGAQTEADSFLQRAATPILVSSAYAEHGLILITFGSGGQEAGLSATTLTDQPPTGALLLSPTLKAGGHSSEAFNSLAPRESLEAIFGQS